MNINNISKKFEETKYLNINKESRIFKIFILIFSLLSFLIGIATFIMIAIVIFFFGDSSTSVVLPNNEAIPFVVIMISTLTLLFFWSPFFYLIVLILSIAKKFVDKKSLDPNNLKNNKYLNIGLWPIACSFLWIFILVEFKNKPKPISSIKKLWWWSLTSFLLFVLSIIFWSLGAVSFNNFAGFVLMGEIGIILSLFFWSIIASYSYFIKNKYDINLPRFSYYPFTCLILWITLVKEIKKLNKIII